MTKTVLVKRIQLMFAALLVALTVGGGFALDDASAKPHDMGDCYLPGKGCESPDP
jgi:hypothetical protein